MFSQRVKNWERGAPDNRATTPKNVKRRLEDFRAGVYMQTLLRDPAAGIMHSLIYFSFLILLAVTTVARDQPPAARSARSSCTARRTRAYSFVGDVAGLAFLDRRRVGDRAPLRASGRTASASSPSPSTR